LIIQCGLRNKKSTRCTEMGLILGVSSAGDSFIHMKQP
jgi:hypothetical protein